MPAVDAGGVRLLRDLYASFMGRVIEMIKEVEKTCLEDDIMRSWETGVEGYNVGAIRSAEPIRNWQEEWREEKSLGVNCFERMLWTKRCWSDYGCITACMKVSAVREGPYGGAIVDTSDHELQAYLGIVYLVSKRDDLGLCGIQCGNVIGLGGELYQRGILTRKDVSFELRWDEYRIPKSSTLKKLSLEKLEPAIKKIKERIHVS